MPAPTKFLWLELTSKCQLACPHCYAGSGPSGDHGTQTVDDWERLLNDAAGMGVENVQFIGGEPTLYPELTRLIRKALGLGLRVEVFTNLVHVTAEHWAAFELPGVSLASSFYSDDPEQHQQATGRATFARTKDNIAEAVRREIPIRIGIIGVHADQRIEEARQLLVSMGVREIDTDEARDLGRGTKPNAEDLCGHCGQGAAAILPNGTVTPCPMSRWVGVGNVNDPGGLAVLVGEPMRTAVAELVPCQGNRDDSAGDPPCSPNWAVHFGRITG
jgi:MoaA/NifB/PqqE/SkfB family radical SAM enzyme